MYIGITGLYCSGKDSVAEMLIKKGFGHLSLSDAVRDEMKKQGIEITRDNLIKFANQMREKEGNGIFARIVARVIEKNELNHVVITSIRHPEEIKELEKLPNFFMISVDSPIDIRFKRALERNRENEPKTLKDFKAHEDFERKGKGNQQQIDVCIKQSRIHVLNDSTTKELQHKVEKLLEDLNKKVMRPDWDRYFLDIVRSVSKRATCDRGRTACIIVKEKRIIATGYVGSPIGSPHCDDVGHLYEIRYDEKGNKTQHCIRTIHGEANAIAQAARYGISVDGATVYMKLAPCFVCAKLMINAGIKRVVCLKGYHGASLSIAAFKEAGVKLDILDKEVETYHRM